jgi:pyrroloquinoline quinone (PQQ) biosynthesis protein C
MRSSLRAHVQRAYEAHVAGLQHSLGYARLKNGTATRAEYDALIVKVCETHFASAHFVAFAFSLAPPRAVSNLAHNLVEEMGTDSEVAHSELLVRLLAGAELTEREPAARQAARYRLRDRVMEPLFYGSLREVGLAALVEIVGFEFMLSRLASEFALLLAEHRGLTVDALEWFTHHSEVDLEHAEQGLDAIVQYVEYYELEQQEATDIIDSALEENIYLKHYFGSKLAANAKQVTSSNSGQS